MSMTLDDYYHSQFSNDLRNVLEGLPSLHQHGSDDVTLQPRSLSTANPIVRRWEKDRLGLFASALFLTVLADQVCYTHFPEHYATFRALTRYPKWRGDCPGGCGTHIHPAVVFRVIGQSPGPVHSRDRPDYSALPSDLIATLKREITSFFPRHLPAIDAMAFLARCDSEVPVDLRLLHLAPRHAE
jgi:hypothetical protein